MMFFRDMEEGIIFLKPKSTERSFHRNSQEGDTPLSLGGYDGPGPSLCLENPKGKREHLEEGELCGIQPASPKSVRTKYA